MIHVVVYSLGDGVVDFDVGHACTVAGVKSHIAELLQVPELFQRLIPLDGPAAKELTDRAPLAAHCTAADDADEGEQRQVELSLVLSLEAARRSLEHGSPQARLRAVKDLSSLGRRASDGAALEVVKRLQDTHGTVREAAVQALPLLVSRGDEAAIEALARCSTDACKDVRMGALTALTLVAERGDLAAVAAAGRFLEDDSLGVREMAQEVLTGLVDKKTRRCAFSQVGHLLEHSSEEVRASAMQALCALAPRRGHALPLAEVTRRVSYSTAEVRVAALEALRFLAQRGDEAAIGLATARLRDEDGCVREAALHTLRLVAPRGEEQVLQEVRRCLVPEEPEAVRVAAVRSMASLAGWGDLAVASSVVACMEEESEEVRHAAVQSVAALEGCGPGATALVAHLAGNTAVPAEARAAAVEALALLARELRRSASGAAEEAAVSASAAITAFDTICTCLQDPSELVRFRSVLALRTAAAAAPRSRVAAALELLHRRAVDDHCDEVRRAAVKALNDLETLAAAACVVTGGARASSEDAAAEALVLEPPKPVAEAPGAARRGEPAVQTPILPHRRRRRPVVSAAALAA